MASKLKKPAKAFLNAIFSKAASLKGFNTIYKAVKVQTNGFELIKCERSFPRAEDVYTVSSTADFDERKKCAEIGVVIRQGVLPVLSIAAKLECQNSEEGSGLGIALGAQKAFELGICELEVQMDNWSEAYEFFKSNKTLQKKHVNATKVLNAARQLLNYKNFKMTGRTVMKNEIKAAHHLLRIARTMEVDREKIWETVVPRGLKEILVDDIGVTKVYFRPTTKKIPVNPVKFEFVPKEMDGKAVGKKERFRKKKIVSQWFEELAEDICERKIEYILVRRRVQREIYCDINIHINYNWNRCPQKMKFDMSTKDLQSFDIFNSLVEGGPEQCNIEVYKQFRLRTDDKEMLKKTDEKIVDLEYSREKMRLPACEIMVIHDFGIFEMMATVTCPQKGSKIEDISDDLMKLQQIEEDSDGLEPRNLFKVGETLKLP